MNTTKRIAQIALLIAILATCQDIARRNLVAAEESGIAPVNISEVYGNKFEGNTFITIILDQRIDPDDDGGCEPGPRLKVVYQAYPVLTEPNVIEFSPDQPPSRPGCEVDFRAANQFAASLYMYVRSEGEEIAVGPIEGLYWSWADLYDHLVRVQDETLDMQQIFMPIIIR